MWCEQIASNHNRSTYVRLLLEWWLVKLLICNFVVKLTRIQLVFCLKKGLLCNLGSLLQKFWLLHLTGQKQVVSGQKHACSTEQHDWHLPGRWLMPCIVAGTTGKLNSHGFSFWLKSPSYICETAPKSLFWAPIYVPRFEYVPWLAC